MSRVAVFFNLNSYMQWKIFKFACCVTLKQTHNEKGSVTATRPHEMAVRIQPQSPIPFSDSSAVIKNGYIYKIQKKIGKKCIPLR